MLPPLSKKVPLQDAIGAPVMTKVWLNADVHRKRKIQRSGLYVIARGMSGESVAKENKMPDTSGADFAVSGILRCGRRWCSSKLDATAAYCFWPSCFGAIAPGDVGVRAPG